MKTTIQSVLSIVLTLITLSVSAQDLNVHNSEAIDVVNANTLITSQDQYYEEILSQTYSNFSIQHQEAYVLLSYEQSLKTFYSQDWMTEITYDVTLVYEDGSFVLIEDEELEVTFNLDTPYQEQELKLYPGAIFAEVKNVCVNCSGQNNVDYQTPPDCRLEVGINSHKRFALQETVPPVITQFQLENNQNEFELAWSKPIGATKYEIEWLFYELGENEDYSQWSQLTPNWRNAVRVQLDQNHYTIPNTYPRGILAVRARAVGEDISTGNRTVTPWSTDDDATYEFALAIQTQTAFSDLNWSVSQTFGENGRRSVSLSFADDQMRTRQSVTIQNTDDLAIVHSNVYDFNGRETVQTLPTPQPNQGYHFYEDQLWDASSNRYFDYSYFDIWDGVENTVENNLPLHPGGEGDEGPGNYYSSSNVGLGHHGEYVADAQGYPYARTVLSKDGSGRAMKTSGVGIDHAIIDGHEHVTSYFYGNPNQEELDSLFGNEVGYASQYLKTVSVDPDGQGHVVITDLKGRKVAEYMTGSNPESLLPLDHLETSNGEIVGDETYIDLTFYNITDSWEDAIEAEHTFVVVEPSEHTFYYDLFPNTFTVGCSGMNINPKYNIYIDLYRVVNASDITLEEELIYHFEELGVDSWDDGNVGYQASPPILIPGTYRIHKRLELDQEGMQQELSNYMAEPNCYQPLAPANFTCDECWNDCFESYYLRDGDQVRFINGDGTTTVIADNFNPAEQTLVAYLDAVDALNNVPEGYDALIANARIQIEQCASDCDNPVAEPLDWCSFYMTQMLDAMSPGGQYFDNLSESIDEYGVYNSGYDMNGWLTSELISIENVVSTSLCNFGYQLSDFQNQGIYDWDDLRTNWELFVEIYPNFPDQFIMYHPEFCQYDVRCDVMLSKESCSGGIISGEISVDFWNYPDHVDQQISSGGMLGIEVFNPVHTGWNLTMDTDFTGTQFNTNLQYNNYIGAYANGLCVNAGMNIDELPLDWFIAGHRDGVLDLERQEMKYLVEANLRNFIKYYDDQSLLDDDKYMSIWYVLDDPHDIANNPPSGLDPVVANLFASLEENGYIGANADESSKAYFFQSVYRFYRELAFDAYLEFVEPVESCITGFCGSIEPLGNPEPLDLLNGGLFQNASAGNFILFPNRPMFDELIEGWQTSWGSGNNNSVTDESNVYIADYSVLDEFYDEDVEDGMADDVADLFCSVDCGVYIAEVLEYVEDSYPSYFGAGGEELELLESLLMTLCTNGCNLLETVSLNHVLGGGVYVSYLGVDYYDLNDLINDHFVDIWNANENLVVPSSETLTAGQAPIACNCSNLANFIEGYNVFANPTIDLAGISNNGSFLDYIIEEFYETSDAQPSLTDLNQWAQECDGLYSASLNNFPPSFSCGVSAFSSVGQMACEVVLADMEQEIFDAESANYEVLAEQEFLDLYMQNWYENLDDREFFKMKYTKMDYQSTLYYYDQAGNLVKTVPPAGVHPLSGSDIDLVQQYREDQLGNFMDPNHQMETVYTYNSLQQMVKSSTPDGGIENFWYDDLDRIIASQNDKQLANNCFSYTLYDELSRPYESGQACGVSIPPGTYFSQADFELLINASTTKEDVNYTWYDASVASQEVLGALADGTQDNLRNRVSMVAHIREMTPQELPENKYLSATVFSYDIHGNVKEAVQEFPELHVINQGTKKIEYDYDVFSGNVHEVKYQWGEWDQFAHRYEYDADNRLHAVFTTTDGRFWHNDAKYFYYAHGPLARTEIGDNQVAAQDFAYTIQGWVKGVNSATLQRFRDIGKDGFEDVNSPKVNSHFAEDSYGYTLDYFEGDYKAVTDGQISTANHFELESLSAFDSDIFDLYSGNISAISHAFSQELSIPNVGVMNHHTAIYRYDQLHRIKQANYVITPLNDPTLLGNNVHPLGSALSDDFASSYSFDPNGNIETLVRNGHTMLNPSDLAMDNFTYNYTYEDVNLPDEERYRNRLTYVQDAVDSPWDNDLDGQLQDNYEYDEIGQLIQDAEDGIGWIEWNTQNKVERVIRPDQVNGVYLSDLEFIYDQGGNRIAKIEKFRNANGFMKDETEWKVQYYARDPMGTELAIYDLAIAPAQQPLEYDLIFTLQGTHLNGSSRLGMLTDGRSIGVTISNLSLSPKTVYYGTDGTSSLTDYVIGAATYQLNQISSSDEQFADITGFKQFEISNHLGNVTAVIGDAKTLEYDQNTQYYVFKPRVTALNDYYPFGMLMPGRTFAQEDYRYGFQGQEADDELKGDGNSVNYKFRMHDARIGRFLSLDPLAPDYPHNSPYAFSENIVINGIELEGAEHKRVIHWFELGLDGEAIIVRTEVDIDQYARFNDDLYAYAVTDHYYINKETGEVFEGEPLIEKFDNLTTIGIDYHAPSAIYDYTLDEDEDKFIDDRNWINQENGYDDGYPFVFDFVGASVVRHRQIISRDWNAPDNASTVEDVNVLTLSTGAVPGVWGGRWVSESTRGWSSFSKSYQELITGVKAGKTYRLNNVNFDGISSSGVLLEAKGKYKWLLERNWVQSSFLKQATRQVNAAEGATIEWYFAEKEAADIVRELFQREGIGIKVFHQSMK
ncbi:Tox-REase-5 domain-containing protein [Sanyastnella coralliicola]|uniref:Tox-REase-5 domain-containing protein n=1 Tax=Sanyastnella coralliicola TaxID=3069118 RepID=UPI0027BA5783|nr:Tox-REase-5 domain-containing protein [Longitalea sp. SCSIO 12813]